MSAERDRVAALAHQTGWTGVVADLIRRQYGAVPSIADAVGLLAAQTAAP